MYVDNMVLNHSYLSSSVMSESLVSWLITSAAEQTSSRGLHSQRSTIGEECSKDRKSLQGTKEHKWNMQLKVVTSTNDTLYTAYNMLYAHAYIRSIYVHTYSI